MRRRASDMERGKARHAVLMHMHMLMPRRASDKERGKGWHAVLKDLDWLDQRPSDFRIADAHGHALLADAVHVHGACVWCMCMVNVHVCICACVRMRTRMSGSCRLQTLNLFSGEPHGKKFRAALDQRVKVFSLEMHALHACMH